MRDRYATTSTHHGLVLVGFALTPRNMTLQSSWEALSTTAEPIQFRGWRGFPQPDHSIVHKRRLRDVGAGWIKAGTRCLPVPRGETVDQWSLRAGQCSPNEERLPDYLQDLRLTRRPKGLLCKRKPDHQKGSRPEGSLVASWSRTAEVFHLMGGMCFLQRRL